MPFDIKPIGAPTPDAYPSMGESFDYFSRQPYSRDLAAYTTSGYRPNSAQGGLDTEGLMSVLRNQSDPSLGTQVATPPPLLSPAKTQSAWARAGTFTLDLIDPFTTVDKMTGESIGRTQPVVGDKGILDPVQFLERRDIGLANAPARLADYAVAIPTAILSGIFGTNATGDGKLHGMQYKFQEDPGYWMLVGNATDQQLSEMASRVAGRYVDPQANGAFVAKLLNQFKADRDVVHGFSSGNQQIDQTAKAYFAYDLVSRNDPDPARWASAGASVGAFTSGLLGAVPFVGAGLQQTLYPTDPNVEKAWRALSPDERKAYLGRAGDVGTLWGFAAMIPLLSGVGAVTAAAKGMGGIAGAAYRGYDLALRGTNALMATGITVATATAAAEWAFPQYSEWLQRNIDGARPVSNSNFAGLVNNIGYFSSGTFGINLAVRSWARVAGKAAGVVGEAVEATTGLKGPTVLGSRELAFSVEGFGGSATRTMVAKAGIDPGLLETSVRTTYLSHIVNWLNDVRQQGWEAALRGELTGLPIDGLTAAEKMAMANDILSRTAEGAQAEAIAVVQFIAKAREPRPLNPSIEVRDLYSAATKMERWIDNEMAKTYVGSYGPEWIMRRTGGPYTEAVVSQYARGLADSFGGNGKSLVARGVEAWANVVRTLYNAGFALRNAELIEAAKGAKEADRATLVRSDRLFRDIADRALVTLRGEDKAAAQQTATRIVKTTTEGADWYAGKWHPKSDAKSPDTVDPGALADYIEEIQAGLLHRRGLVDPTAPTAAEPLNAFHRKLRDEGLWEIAFKPTDAAGNPVSYVHLSDGSFFRSPWVDYPVGSAESIAIGNRGILGRRLDDVFRGFRTQRIAEFQKAMLFRNVSSRVDVAPEQIAEFYQGVLRLARRNNMQAQTVGSTARGARIIPGAVALKEDLDKLAERVFGKDLVGRDGKPVDWPTEVARSFVQSYKLNVSAGLTSHLKSNLGEQGAAIAWMSDVGYLMWRFNLSPLFKGGELWESAQLNAQYGVAVDSAVQGLYHRIGVGNDYGPLNAELAFDPKIMGATGPSAAPLATHRDAASLAHYSRLLPEDLRVRTAEAKAQEPAVAWSAKHGGGNLPTEGAPDPGLRAAAPDRPVYQPADPAKYAGKVEMVPVAVLNRYLEMDRTVRPKMRGDDPMATLQSLADDIKKNGLRDPVVVEYDPATRTAMVTDGNHRIAAAPMAGLDSLPTRVIVAQHRTRPEFVGADKIQPEYMPVTGYDKVKPDGYIPADLTPTDIGLGGEPGAPIATETVRVARLADLPADYTLDAAHFELAKDWYEPGSPLDDRGLYHATTAMDRVYAEGLRPGAETRNTGLGPGIKQSDRNFISVTGRWGVADLIAERLRVAVRAARNEIKATEILDHFSEPFMDDYGAIGDALGISGATSWTTLEKAVSRRYRTGAAKYDMVRRLDDTLGATERSLDEAEYMHVGLTASVDEMAKVDPSQIGVVQVAARQAAKPTLGQDSNAFELRFRKPDLMVIDDRPVLDPLPEDAAGLLTELRATMARGETGRPMTDSELNAIVGGTGTVPGLDARAAAILEKLRALREKQVDNGPTFAWNDIDLERKLAFQQKLGSEGWMPFTSMVVDGRAVGVRFERTGLDGVLERKSIEDLWDQAQRTPSASNMAEVAGTTEALFENVLPTRAAQAALEGGTAAQAWETFKHPTAYKMDKALKLQMEIVGREFGSLLRMAHLDGPVAVFKELGVPEAKWAEFLLRDRELAQKWWSTNDPADLAALMDHAGDSAAARAGLDKLYASEDWQVLTALQAINLKAAQEEAFGIHFFSPYRSALERSLNHPVLGVYPLSWALKVAREWTRFLYDNRTFGHGTLRLGMYPAQAIAAIVNMQRATFAQTNPDTLDHWLYKGPLGSPIFIFNLLLPGDWSAIPFPATRTIRDLARPVLQGQAPNPGVILEQQLANMGVTRDVRLFLQTAGEIGGLVDAKAKDPSLVIKGHTVLGQAAQDWWTDISTR